MPPGHDRPAVLMRAPAPPDSPALIAARLAALLARHGITHVYTTAGRNRAVISVGHDLTAWTDGRQLWCTRDGHRETWPAADTMAAATRLATLAHQEKNTQATSSTHPGDTPERTPDVSDSAAADDSAAMNTSRGPFAVDGKRALDALTLTWADQYDKIWFHPDAGWAAHHKDAAEHDVITGSTPDELNRNIRADWQRREGQP